MPALTSSRDDAALGDGLLQPMEELVPLMQAGRLDVAGGASQGSSDIKIELVSGRWRDRLWGSALAIVVLVLMLVVVLALFESLYTSPSQRGWVILGLTYYIGSTWRLAWDRLEVILWRSLYIRVVVDRMSAMTLFEAITARLEGLADQRAPEFASRDSEAFTSYDVVTGQQSVKFSFWGTRPKHVRFRLQPPPEVAGTRNPIVLVEYTFGDNMICGRDSRVERNRHLTMWITSSTETVAEDKRLLNHWCQDCLGKALEPPPDRVGVYGLQQSSTDWIQEWGLDRTKTVKSGEHTGDRFYLERKEFKRLRTDAVMWASSDLRLYMVTGPPGVGKSEFTLWLAGCLCWPVYRLSLTMDNLTDARLAQLLSASSMKHDALILQVDEFQEVLSRWEKNDNSIAVTPGGFNEALQGCATREQGIVVLSGTHSEKQLEAHPALLRRLSMKITLAYPGLADAG